MNKVRINGEDYISVRELREEIRSLRRKIPEIYRNFDESHQAMIHLAYNDILKAVYREELQNAGTPDEIRKIIRGDG